MKETKKMVETARKRREEGEKEGEKEGEERRRERRRRRKKDHLGHETPKGDDTRRSFSFLFFFMFFSIFPL